MKKVFLISSALCGSIAFFACEKNTGTKYQAFYTKSTPIVDYMVQQLNLKPTDKIFEPCGGDGVFIEAIIADNAVANIDVCEELETPLNEVIKTIYRF